MEIFTIILLAIIIILIISNKNTSDQKTRELEYRLSEIQNLLKKREHAEKVVETPMTSPKPDAVKEHEKPAVPDPQTPPKPTEIMPEPIIERHPEIINEHTPVIRKPIKTFDPPKKIIREPELSFFERYPDLENFIGENLVNKIGIAILVLAIGFFVKYAIDNDWVGPVGRVGIGIVCGGILIGFAHRMRKNYKSFSSVLVGGGLAIFYFTITLAYQQFHLFPNQLVAFIILIVITIFAVVLALLYDRQELAVIALIGGFASPFMVSNGSANYNGLFLYLVILDIGLLIIAYYKAWRILNISAFVLSSLVFTTILFALTKTTYYIGFIYAGVFYLMFFFINIINNVKENKKFVAADFTILLANTAIYFSSGLYLLTQMGAENYRGLFSATLAALNLSLSFILFKNRKVDTNILYLLIGITLTFISLTAPIQLHGNNITLFWASEAVLLYWLYQKSGINLMKLTSLLIWLAMILSLLMDLSDIYLHSGLALTIIANKGFITTLFSAISCYFMFVLVKRDPKPQIYGIALYADLYRVCALILLFLSGAIEINYQFSYYFPGTDINIIYLMLYVPVFVYLFHVISVKLNGKAYKWQLSLILLCSCVALYLILNPIFFGVLADILEHRKINSGNYAAHWVSAVFIAMIMYAIVRICQDKLPEQYTVAASWIVVATVVLFLSLEICLISMILFYSAKSPVDLVQTVYVKTGLPVLWGLVSFVLMWLGMRNKQRTLRIISLSLFLLTLLKLFLFDINNIPVAGKIAAFFCLGILLLIISFMYQKVKKIIVEDEEQPKE